MRSSISEDRPVWTALQYSRLVQTRRVALHQFLSRVHRIVVLCDWAHDVLVRNAVADEKIMLSQHGLVDMPRQQQTRSPKTGPFRLMFLGRLHPTKGVHVLVRALQRLDGNDVELHVFGVVQPGDEKYAEDLRALARLQTNVVFHPPVPSHAVIELLTDFDMLAVPSQWLETGPLVVLEAFAAGVPVLGSRLGGIAELVRDGVDGLLVQYESVDAWTDILRRLAHDRTLLDRLRAGVRPPRQMRAVAEDMLALYDDIAVRPGGGRGVKTATRARYIAWAARGWLGADRSCPGCGSTRTRLLKRKHLVTALYGCDTCALMFRMPKTSPIEDRLFYQDDYEQGGTTDLPSMLELEELKRASFGPIGRNYSDYIHVLRAIGVRPGHTIYDYGASWGYGSWQFAQAGYRVYSFEIGRARARLRGRVPGLPRA